MNSEKNPIFDLASLERVRVPEGWWRSGGWSTMHKMGIYEGGMRVIGMLSINYPILFKRPSPTL